eukprot:COSAG05_NODE_214_length_13907_cov_28.992178_16_plen_75_part_00
MSAVCCCGMMQERDEFDLWLGGLINSIENERCATPLPPPHLPPARSCMGGYCTNFSQLPGNSHMYSGLCTEAVL